MVFKPNRGLFCKIIDLKVISKEENTNAQCALNMILMSKDLSITICNLYQVFTFFFYFSESHLVIATKDEQQAKYPCLICDEDFQFKGLRDQHMKQCKKDFGKIRYIMAPKVISFSFIYNIIATHEHIRSGSR